MSTQSNKRAVICGIAILPVSAITMSESIAQPTVVITSTSSAEYLRVQSASFSERKSESGDYVEQNLECVFTDTSQTNVAGKRDWVDEDAIVLLKYSNNEVRVVGTKLVPVRCEFEESGNPRSIRLSFKRKSPEFSKILQSLS